MRTGKKTSKDQHNVSVCVCLPLYLEVTHPRHVSYCECTLTVCLTHYSREGNKGEDLHLVKPANLLRKSLKEVVEFSASINICKSFSAHWCNRSSPVSASPALHIHETIINYFHLSASLPRKKMATLACDRTSSKYLNSLHPNLADTQRMPASHARFQEGRIHMHMSISAPGDIPQSDRQAKGQNSNLLLHLKN